MPSPLSSLLSSAAAVAAAPKMNLIAAQCIGGGIGKEGTIPWNLKREYAHFRIMTRSVKEASKRNAVIMGRKTWESIGAKPLKGRLNVILSRTLIQCPDDCLLAPSLDEALSLLLSPPHVDALETIWILGGENIYRESLAHPLCHRVYLTKIDAHFDCDTFFPSVDESLFDLVADSEAPQGPQTENGLVWECQVWQKRQQQ